MSVRAMPLHRANDSPTEATVGSQTSSSSTSVGTPTMMPSTTRSRVVSWRSRRRGRDGIWDPVPGASSGVTVEVTVRSLLALGVERLGLLVEVREVDRARLEEVLQGGVHDVVRHGGQRIPVEEL